eukprot:2195438-Rhodomonas_salina.9
MEQHAQATRSIPPSFQEFNLPCLGLTPRVQFSMPGTDTRPCDIRHTFFKPSARCRGPKHTRPTVQATEWL